jgi:hypothetical protein
MRSLGYDPRIPLLDADLSRFLGVPRTKNKGIMQIGLTAADALTMLQYNRNRRLLEDRTYGMTGSMISGSFLEDSPDPILIDWDSWMFNCQKRLLSLAKASERLHHRYRGYLIFRLEFGLDPLWRSLIDNVQERATHISVTLVSNATLNKRVVEMIKFAYPIYSGRTSSTLISNIDDIKRIFGVNSSAFLWAANLKMSYGYGKIPVRYAFAELYMQSPRIAQIAADALFNAGAGNQRYIPQMEAFKSVVNANMRAGKPPFGSHCAGTQGPHLYAAVVPFLDALLQDKAVSPQMPSKIAMAKSWTNRQDAIYVPFERALTSPVPAHIALVKPEPEPDEMANANHLARHLTQRGCINAPTVCAAVRLVYPKNGLDPKMIIKNLEHWNRVSHKAVNLYRCQEDKFCQPAAICAFLWVALCEKHFEEAVSFMEAKLKNITAILASQPNKKGTRALPIKGVWGFLMRAFEASQKNEPLPLTL